MGLDMFAYAVPADPSRPQVDAELGEERKEIFYWRKHPDLHGWMEDLYRAKGGEGDFNCKTVKLNPDDLNELERAVTQLALPKTRGFFFGESRPEDRQQDLKFIAKARQAIADGMDVYYDSWW